ncbi:MAG: Ig-like domain-containing protein [Gallionella sp.]|nr:Ig-like domain-containing protein [Gallionella sp.]
MSLLRCKLSNSSRGLGLSLLGLIALILSACGGGGATSAPASKTTTTTTLASIDITPVSISMLSGSTINLVATGSYSDGTAANLTSQVTWAPANSAIATTSTTGVATAVSPGNTTITASMSGVTSPAASITVTGGTTPTGINISPATVTAPLGQTVTFVAMGTFADLTTGNVSGSATWTSSNTSVATVSNGNATTLVAGSTTITASIGSLTSTAALTVTAPVAGTGPLSGATWTYTSPTNAIWSQVGDATVPNGGNVYKAPAILDGQSTTANVTVNVPAAGNVSFYYKVSSEADYDYLIFTIDGVEPATARWSGLVPWALASYPVTAGAHTLRWEYLKDSLLSANLDTAWLSQVSIPAAAAPPGTAVGTQMGGARQDVPLALTTAVTTLAGSGLIGSVNGTGTAASFSNPRGITTDGVNLYVADTINHKIRKIVIATGAVTTLAGSGTAGAVDATGTAASFNGPYGITTDGTSLYVSDTSNHKIRKIVIVTGVVTTLAGSGTVGAVDATGTAASFNGPFDITTDGASLYVADAYNHKIRKIVIATSAVTTLAGSGVTGAVDGTGTAASFNYPYGITTDGTSLYVGDSSNQKIRKIVIATGAVTTLAGSGAIGATDGTGTAASFYFPVNITTDGASLYVVDTANNKIRKIQ